MNSTLKKTMLHFEEGILTVSFVDHTVVEVEDLIYIYSFAFQESKGQPYGVLFDSSSQHEFSEEAIVYFADSVHTHNVVALAYVSRTLLSKIRLQLLLIFEKPLLKPKIFHDEVPAYEWLRQQVDDAVES